MGRVVGSQEQPLAIGFQALREQQQQMAASLPLETAAEDSVSLSLAGSIKPTGTVGSIVADLMTNRPGGTDHKVVLFRGDFDAPAQAFLFPASKAIADVVDPATLIGTITRDDSTKDVSAHTFAKDAGFTANGLTAAITAALAAQKPRRNVSALVNALADMQDELEETGLVFVFDNTGNGSLKIYSGGLNSDTGKVAEVSQTAAEPTAAAPTIW